MTTSTSLPFFTAIFLAFSGALVEELMVMCRHVTTELAITTKSVTCRVTLMVFMRSILRTVVGFSSRLWPCACLASLSILPDAMLSVVLGPIIKDKCGKINSKANYRHDALASVTSKIVYMILLDRMSDGLTPCQTIWVMKEIVDRFNCLNGSTLMCFLDASKAFS